MVLDNYWVQPELTPENLAMYYAQKEEIDSPICEPMEFEFAFDIAPVSYRGTRELTLHSSIITDGKSSFRGRIYTRLCDALLLDAGDTVFQRNWLYYNHFSDEIKIAYRLMQKHQRLLLSKGNVYFDELKQIFTSLEEPFMTTQKFDDCLTLESTLDFIEMFQYFSQIEHICLLAWD